MLCSVRGDQGGKFSTEGDVEACQQAQNPGSGDRLSENPPSVVGDQLGRLDRCQKTFFHCSMKRVAGSKVTSAGAFLLYARPMSFASFSHAGRLRSIIPISTQ